MRRRSTDDGDGGLDSLLDTMTNVVGILVIVLVVTQLGVGDAVKRITDAIQIDAQQLAEAEKKLEAARADHDRLLAAMADEDPQDNEKEDYDQRLQELEQQIAQQEKILERMEAQKEASQEELQARMQQVVDTKQREEEINKAREQVAKLNETWGSNDEQLQTLQALLAETPVQPAVPAREITLPDPRPAPEGAEQLTIICSQNKVYLLPPGATMEQLVRKPAQARAQQIALKQRRTFNPLTGEGVERFLQEFNERPLRAPKDYFDVEMYDSSGSPRLRFIPRESHGEDERAVKGARSNFQDVLRRIDRSKYFIRFYVCADSFDIYVTTRRIVSDMNLLAGWEPQSANWTYTTHLGGDVRLGPKPPPTPPKPVPPGPAKPKKPVNVID